MVSLGNGLTQNSDIIGDAFMLPENLRGVFSVFLTIHCFSKIILLVDLLMHVLDLKIYGMNTLLAFTMPNI